MMLWPAHLWNAPRVVTGNRAKCWHPACLTICGSQYSGRYVCERHAREQMVIEQRAREQRAEFEGRRPAVVVESEVPY